MIDARLAHWETPEGRPFTNKLIDMRAYEKDTADIGCMCAQGQALHLIAGWSPESLRTVDQHVADRAFAELFNISVAHSVLVRKINDSKDGAPADVLTNPKKYLGDNWAAILDFWWVSESMQVSPVAREFSYQERYDDIRQLANAVAGWDVQWHARCTGVGDERCAASLEIICGEQLIQQDLAFMFLPLFGFADPSKITPRPDNYGRLTQ